MRQAQCLDALRSFTEPNLSNFELPVAWEPEKSLEEMQTLMDEIDAELGPVDPVYRFPHLSGGRCRAVLNPPRLMHSRSAVRSHPFLSSSHHR